LWILFHINLVQYIILYRGDASDAKFKSWIKNNPAARARIVDNRLTLPDYQALGLFQLSWMEEWDLTVIWDSWQRRHIVIQ
jgi:hypothetical protein